MDPKCFIVGAAVVFCGTQAVVADTLTFIAQPLSGGGIDYGWFSAANWFTTNSTGALIPAGRAPQTDDSAVITGLVDGGAYAIRVAGLVATNGAIVTDGTFSIENLQMLSNSAFSNSTVNILVTVTATGTNCLLNSTTLNVLSIASGTFEAAGPVGTPTLVLTQGSTLQIGGRLTLTDGVVLGGGGLPQNQITINSLGLLEAYNSAVVTGSATGHLIFDNSGTIQADSGTVLFQDGIDWQCSGGSGEFDAAGASAGFIFDAPFQCPAGATNLFLGAGRSYFNAGGTIDGALQVGGVDLGTQVAVAGNAAIADSLSGLGTFEVTAAGASGSVLTWSNGILSLVSVSIDTNSQLFISGHAGTSRQLAGCALNNAGTCTVLAGDLGFSEGGAISNLSSGTFQIEADGAFSGSPLPGGGVFDNAGTVIKSSDGVTQFGAPGSGAAPEFNNSGLVNLSNGQLNLGAGASSGTFQTASNCVLSFWGGTHLLNPGAVFNGPGSVRVVQGFSAPTLVLSGSIVVPELEVGTNGILQCPGTVTTNAIQLGTLLTRANALLTNGYFTAQNVQLLDSSTLAGCVLSVSNTFWIGGASGSGTNLQFPGSVLNNSGSCQWLAPGPVSAGAGAILNNLPGASLDLETDTTVTAGSVGPQLVINNAGAFVKVGGNGVSAMAADFNNSGTMRIDNGSLSFSGSLQQSLGNCIVASGATLGAAAVNVQGGSLSGNGTVAAPVSNGANVSPGSSAGILTLAAGNGYQQGAAGVLGIELGGINPGSQFNQLQVGGSASLNGTLQVSLTNGFVPQSGEQFQILSCASQTGTFSSVDVPPLAGAQWLIRYGTTNVTLVVAGELTLAEPVISSGTFRVAFNTSPGIEYVVQTSDRLNPAAWQTLTTVAGDGTTKSVSDSAFRNQRFYRVLLQ